MLRRTGSSSCSSGSRLSGFWFLVFKNLVFALSQLWAAVICGEEKDALMTEFACIILRLSIIYQPTIKAAIDSSGTCLALQLVDIPVATCPSQHPGLLLCVSYVIGLSLLWASPNNHPPGICYQDLLHLWLTLRAFEYFWNHLTSGGLSITFYHVSRHDSSIFMQRVNGIEIFYEMLLDQESFSSTFCALH